MPLRTVDNKYFKAICDVQGAQSFSRRTLCRKITTYYEKCQQILIGVGNETDYVCTTCDIWSSKRRSFLGVTMHWIDKKFERKSATLACRRFRSSHTAERIAEILRKIHIEYKIDGKIVATVTDNGSNFLKAFTLFGVESIENGIR